MRRLVGISAAWLAATFIAVAVAAAAVGSVRSEVTDAPTALAAPLVAANAKLSLPASGASTTINSDIAETPTTAAPKAEGTTPTTLPERDTSDSSQTTTTTPPATSSTTTTSNTASSYTKTYDTEAGSVRITVSGESVAFSGATPLPGWKVELKNSGPEEVKVHFERNEGEHEDEEIEFKAEIEDGELRVSISEES